MLLAFDTLQNLTNSWQIYIKIGTMEYISLFPVSSVVILVMCILLENVIQVHEMENN